MKKPFKDVIPSYFGNDHIKIKKTPDYLAETLVNTSLINMFTKGKRKKYSSRFLDPENACSLEDILSDIIPGPYRNEEVFFLLKITEEGKADKYYVLRLYKSRKEDFYFAINIMPKEKFKIEKATEKGVFFFKD